MIRLTLWVKKQLILQLTYSLTKKIFKTIFFKKILKQKHICSIQSTGITLPNQLPGSAKTYLSWDPINEWSGKKYLNSELTIWGLNRFEKSLMQPESMVINLYSTTDGKERNIFELPGGIKKLITRQAVQLTRSSWLSSSIVQRSTTWICKDFLQVSASCTSSCYTRYVMSVSDIPMPTRFQQIKQEVCGQFDSRIEKKRQSSRISKTISYIFSNNK